MNLRNAFSQALAPRARRWVGFCAAIVAAVASAGCGLHFSGFLTPVYRIPSGYSETYRDRLEAFERRARQPVLVDPALRNDAAPPPVRLRPVPLPPGSNGTGAAVDRYNPPSHGSNQRGGAGSR